MGIYRRENKWKEKKLYQMVDSGSEGSIRQKRYAQHREVQRKAAAGPVSRQNILVDNDHLKR